MEFTEFTLRVLLLFAPGIIATMLENKCTNRREESIIIFFVRAFIYGLLSYCFIFIIVQLLNCFIEIIINNYVESDDVKIRKIEVYFLEALQKEKISIKYAEMIWSTIICVVMALFKSSTYNIISLHNHLIDPDDNLKRNFFTRIVLKINAFLEDNKIKISGQGNDDVWNYVFNNLHNWIIVCDYENNIRYMGILASCSNNHKHAELFLENVEIYELNTTTKLRDAKAVYLSKEDSSSWYIEIDFKGGN